MGLQPQGASSDRRIDASLDPPGGLVTAVMDLTMMAPAERDCELVTNLATKRRRLCKSQVMGVGGPTATDQARVFGNRLDMLAVANSARGWQGQDAFVDDRLSPLASPRLWMFRLIGPRDFV